MSFTALPATRQTTYEEPINGALMQSRGIFIKMFIWFWLAMAVVIAITFVLDRLTDPDSNLTPLCRALEIPLTYYGRIAVEQGEGGNRTGLAATLAGLRSSAGISAYLFDSTGTEIQGKVAPHEVLELVDKMARKGKPAFSFSRARALAAVGISGRSGHRYTVVGMIPDETSNSSGNGMSFLLPRLGIALVISCLACYLLARYLTVPIVRLRDAARQLASGDLTVRVSPAAEKRWDEIGELAHDFDLMAERIQVLLTSQKQLLGNISHELRSPLARLNVALELARRQSTPEAGKFLDRIEWESERLNELIRQLLALTRLEGLMDRTRKELIDLTHLVQYIAADADFEARSRQRSVQLVEQERCTVIGVRDLLRSAVENVVRNAVWYTREGTAVEISLHSLTNRGATQAIVNVRDHGPGVPEEMLLDLFRPFYRAGEVRERQTGGAGLGLAITERAILLHGGKIKAVNASDGGLIVEISIPFGDGLKYFGSPTS
jgi:two-component system sensor histidine kinase CpxA